MISVIIPYKIFDEYVKECLGGFSRINFKDFELILLPDKKTIEPEGLKVIETNGGIPSTKRNTGVENANGDIYAFIDSDAYPHKDWLKNAIKYLKREDVGGIGGPNLIPKGANLWEKVSDDVLSMFIGGGKSSITCKVDNRVQEVVEMPGCNLIVKKKYFKKFDPDLFCSEDTKLCFDIRKQGKKIIYAPDVIVYHHRRNSFYRHLKQMFLYGRDIAFFTRKNFSLDLLYYSILSLWVLGLIIGGILSYFSEILRLIYFGVILFYLIIVLISSVLQNIKRSFLVFVMIILTHIFYGVGYLYGLVTRIKS